ncbi:monovalent cation/H(+) antiporter subunit G [Telmatospirillum sp. J64-1]|uniref:monovalent cation/H(+) antiporter subunit G n=1 Tax=Telmatospirillum sp. J64-1 TaxID=2502183 RepID=UPI00115F3061|nr:monovalent cation/H(+) antiporter subunit G [Telmatospirillum sp. J64-1]
MILDVLSLLLILAGAFFFLAGTVGLLRFPDVFSRLHALTKADTLGLGLVVAGLALRADDWTIVVKLLVVWLLALVAAITIGHLIAHMALRQGLKPWMKAREGGRPQRGDKR